MTTSRTRPRSRWRCATSIPRRSAIFASGARARASDCRRATGPRPTNHAGRVRGNGHAERPIREALFVTCRGRPPGVARRPNASSGARCRARPPWAKGVFLPGVNDVSRRARRPWATCRVRRRKPPRRSLAGRLGVLRSEASSSETHCRGSRPRHRGGSLGNTPSKDRSPYLPPFNGAVLVVDRGPGERRVTRMPGHPQKGKPLVIWFGRGVRRAAGGTRPRRRVLGRRLVGVGVGARLGGRRARVCVGG